MLMLNLGSTDINTGQPEVASGLINHSRFVNAAASGQVLPQVLLNGGADISFSGPGINRYGCFAGGSYTFRKWPVMLRAQFRVTHYRLDLLTGWKALYSGGLELAWRFKLKLFDH